MSHLDARQHGEERRKSGPTWVRPTPLVWRWCCPSLYYPTGYPLGCRRADLQGEPRAVWATRQPNSCNEARKSNILGRAFRFLFKSCPRLDRGNYSVNQFVSGMFGCEMARWWMAVIFPETDINNPRKQKPKQAQEKPCVIIPAAGLLLFPSVVHAYVHDMSSAIDSADVSLLGQSGLEVGDSTHQRHMTYSMLLYPAL